MRNHCLCRWFLALINGALLSNFEHIVYIFILAATSMSRIFDRDTLSSKLTVDFLLVE